MSFISLRSGALSLRRLCFSFNNANLHVQNILLSPRRPLSSGPPEPKTGTNNEFVAIKLSTKSRKLLRISGVDSFIYLQSLLTNDMRRLLPSDRLNLRSEDMFEEMDIFDQPVLYSYLLSAVGKVLADLFVYRGRYRAEDGEYIIEVDSNLATAMRRLLLGYNLSRNVKVEHAKELDLWALVPAANFTDNFTVKHPSNLPELKEIDSDDIKLVRDPRLGPRYLGYRFLTRLGGSRLEDIGKYIKPINNHKEDDDKSQRRMGKLRLYEGSIWDYARLRYRLGVAEGQQECMSGFYFPFELNGDLLNAISLNKGLFTSEEKVVKIYSRDPIKRRIFPIEFICHSSKLNQLAPAPRTTISTMILNKAVAMGELRGRSDRFGIAQLIVPMKNNLFPTFMGARPRFPMLNHDDTGLQMRARIPPWWPTNIHQIQLPVPDYPRCLFNFEAAELEEARNTSHFSGIPEDRFTSSLVVLQDSC